MKKTALQAKIEGKEVVKWRREFKKKQGWLIKTK